MNIQAKSVSLGTPTTPEEFLRWNEGREGKREFVRGRVVDMMIQVTRSHADVAANLLVALRTRLDRRAYSVGSADFGVQTPDGIRYPDVYVDRKAAASHSSDLAATEPLLVAEVLSSSSRRRDFEEKLTDYTRIVPLRHYLVLSQQEPRVWHWARNPSGQWTGPSELAGEEQWLDLSGLGVSFPLSEVYAGIQ